VDAIVAYRTLPAVEARGRVIEAIEGGLDAAVFASPSAVEAFLDAAGVAGRGVPAVVIGSVTEEAARREGLSVRAVAKEASSEGLLRAVLAAASTPPPDRP
jgi:uroporphyrinogen-III synthase